MTTNQLIILGVVVIFIGLLLLIADLTWKFLNRKKTAIKEEESIGLTDLDDESPALNVSSELNKPKTPLGAEDIKINDGFNHDYELPPVAINPNSIKSNPNETLKLSEDMVVSDENLLYNDVEITNNTNNTLSEESIIADRFTDTDIKTEINNEINIDAVENLEHLENDLVILNEDTDINEVVTSDINKPVVTYAAGGRSTLSAKEEADAISQNLEDNSVDTEITEANIDLNNINANIDLNSKDLEVDTLDTENNIDSNLNSDITIDNNFIDEIDTTHIDLDTDLPDTAISIDNIDNLISLNASDIDQVTIDNIDVNTTSTTDENINLNTFTSQSPILDKHLQLSDEQDQNSPLLNAQDNINISILPNNEFSYISGTKLLELVDNFGFKFGTMNMFHRYQNKNGSGLLWFSMMGLTKEGIVPFDLNTLPNTMELKGLVLFLSLPHPKVLQGFDSMMSIAGLIAREVDGFIVDDEGNEMTADYKRQMRTVLQNSLVD